MTGGIVLTSSPQSRYQLLVTGQGFLSESAPRAAAQAGATLTAQTVVASLVGLRAGDTVTNLHFVISTLASTITYAKAGLYSSAGAQLGISGDLSATVGSTGLKTATLTSPCVITADGVYYVALDIDASVAGAVIRCGNFTGAATASGSGVLASGTQAGQATLPGTLSLSSTNNLYWFAVS